ncbi:MAG TPA: branched-chain amino acid ABC transporter permease, partial [Acidobacteria bacterium]|nr:branched-chain amino acid ABC transporter permease [Acidobacteriota bacterium]
TRSPFGRVLQLIRADERLALATGRSPSRFKLVTFVISAALGSVGGAIFAAYIGFVDPSSFTVMVSVMIICMVVIGGAGTVWGALVGAVFLVSMPEALRFVGLPAPVAANLRQILYGALLMLLMVLRPQGFLGRYGLGKRVQ